MCLLSYNPRLRESPLLLFVFLFRISYSSFTLLHKHSVHHPTSPVLDLRPGGVLARLDAGPNLRGQNSKYNNHVSDGVYSFLGATPRDGSA